MSVDGTWKVTLDTPRGSQEAQLELVSQGGLLSGTWSGRLGTRSFSGGTIEGNALNWNVELSSPMGSLTLQFAGTLDGDRINGNVRFGNFGGGTFTAVRA